MLVTLGFTFAENINNFETAVFRGYSVKFLLKRKVFLRSCAVEQCKVEVFGAFVNGFRKREERRNAAAARYADNRFCVSERFINKSAFGSVCRNNTALFPVVENPAGNKAVVNSFDRNLINTF